MPTSTSQEVFVCAEQQFLPETNWLVKELGRGAHPVSLDRTNQVQKGRRFVLYLHGNEPLPEVRSFFRAIFTTNYDWLMVYVAHHSLEAAAKIGFVAGQELTKPAEFVFDAYVLQERLLKMRNVLMHAAQPARISFSAADLSLARKKLELTQEQLAFALQVTARTIQNWERNIATGQLERKTRDLRELLELLSDYVLPGKEGTWLRTRVEAFGNRRPMDLLTEGKLRDLIVEFKRMQEGQPA